MLKASEIKCGQVMEHDAAGFITDGLQGIFVVIIEETPVAIQLPQSVVLGERFG